jgi:hypothetical protein
MAEIGGSGMHCMVLYSRCNRCVLGVLQTLEPSVSLHSKENAQHLRAAAINSVATDMSSHPPYACRPESQKASPSPQPGCVRSRQAALPPPSVSLHSQQAISI